MSVPKPRYIFTQNHFHPQTAGPFLDDCNRYVSNQLFCQQKVMYSVGLHLPPGATTHIFEYQNSTLTDFCDGPCEKLPLKAWTDVMENVDEKHDVKSTNRP